MKNWTIGVRIAAGFAAVILIAAALGVFALSRAAQIGTRTDELSSNYFPSVMALNVVRSNVHECVADLVRLVDSTDAAQIARLNGEIVALRAENNKALSFYESTPFTPEEARLYAEFLETRKQLWSAFDLVQKQGQSTDQSEIAKAQKTFADQLAPLYDKESVQLQQLVELNKKGADAGMASIHDAVSSSSRGILIGLVVAIGIAIPIALFIVRGITGPLSRAVETLGQVAAGDLTASLDIDSKDEVGRMAAALNATVQKLRSTLLEVADGAANTSSVSQQLSAATDAIASGAQEQAASLEQTSASIGETSASLEETSASMEEITATIRQTADNARHADQLASGSREAAESGQGVLSSAIAAMTEINAASAKIADIIGTIDEIAFQTNLLAVNAAVEAARAGEEGRGFAVVATEVRTLAQRSAAAAKEIKALIQDSLRKVEKGTDLVNKSGETLHGIVVSVKRLTDIVGEIAAAAGQQSTGAEQVNTAITQVSTAVGQVSSAVTQMDQVTQSNAAQTEELSSTAGSLADQARRLQELVEAFKLGDASRGNAAPRRPEPRPVAASPARRPAAESRPQTKGARSVAAAKASTALRQASPQAKRAAGAALVPAGHSEGSHPNDDSFEEF